MALKLKTGECAWCNKDFYGASFVTNHSGWDLIGLSKRFCSNKCKNAYNKSKGK